MEEEERLTRGERAAERFTTMVGSWPFIIGQASFLALWFVLNVLPFMFHWDPWPWMGANIIMSTEAAFATSFILIAAAVGARHDRAQAARIESLARTLDEHVNVTAKQHTEELRANTELTREIHRMVVGEGRTSDDRTQGIPDAQPTARGRAQRRRS